MDYFEADVARSQMFITNFHTAPLSIRSMGKTSTLSSNYVYKVESRSFELPTKMTQFIFQTGFPVKLNDVLFV